LKRLCKNKYKNKNDFLHKNPAGSNPVCKRNKMSYRVAGAFREEKHKNIERLFKSGYSKSKPQPGMGYFGVYGSYAALASKTK
jgi:hypothetical protein